MDDRRHRVLHLAGLKRVSDSALEAILEGLGKDNTFRLSRHQLRHAYDREWAAYGTSVVLPLRRLRKRSVRKAWHRQLNLKLYRWHHCRLDLLLQYFTDYAPAFGTLLAETIEKHAGALHLIVYADEVTSGNPLRVDNARKFWGIYVSILEFGHQHLSNESLWLPLAMLRTQVVHQVRGGFSFCMRRLFRSWFCKDPMDLSVGVVLRLPGGSVSVTFGLDIYLADLDAIRACLGVKGTSGIRPCLKCRNCMIKGHPSCRPGAYQVDITCTDMEKLDFTDDSDLWANHDTLVHHHRSGDLNKKSFDELQQAMGLTCNNTGLLGDLDLRLHFKPITATRFDWMHIMFVSGVFNFELRALLKKSKDTMQIGFAQIHAYVGASWCFQDSFMHVAGSCRKVFNESRARAATRREGLKGSASEFLTIYPVVRHFVETILMTNPEMHACGQSFLSLCEVIDTIVSVKRGTFDDVSDAAVAVHVAVTRYRTAASLAYGTKKVKPKSHVLMHVPGQILSDQGVYDCFALERKHQVPKQYAQTVVNFSSFEKSITKRAVNSQLRTLQDLVTGDQLVGKQTRPAALLVALGLGTTCSRHLSWMGAKYATGDIVLIRHRCFLIRACISSNGDLGFIVHELELVNMLSPTSSSWRRPESTLHALMLAQVGRMRTAQAWTWTSPCTATVLHMRL
jgi:hypothetical protein